MAKLDEPWYKNEDIDFDRKLFAWWIIAVVVSTTVSFVGLSIHSPIIAIIGLAVVAACLLFSVWRAAFWFKRI